jgi:hypothetical protein
MTTFLTFLGIVALFVICKFIYDTFLTNNTEKNWQEYKSSNPHEAQVLERNEGLNFKTDYKVRTDGVYMCKHEGISQYGEPFKFTIVLIFNNKNRVIKAETEGIYEIEKSQIREMINEIKDLTELDADCTEFFCDKGKITMKFMNSSTHGVEFSGSVLKNSIILTRTVHYFDHTLERQNTEVTLKNMNFELIKAE